MSTFQKYRVQGIVLGLLMPSLVVAALELPHTFKSGEVISASEMNENFEALREKIEALEESQKELEEEVTALRAAGPRAIELRVSKDGSDDGIALERGRYAGEWPAIVGGTEQPVPAPGLYRVDLSLILQDPSTDNPLSSEVQIKYGTYVVSVYATRWSETADAQVHHNNVAFVWIEDPGTQRISFVTKNAGTTVNTRSRAFIQRLSD